jgi:alkaline phosphatase
MILRTVSWHGVRVSLSFLLALSVCRLPQSWAIASPAFAASRKATSDASARRGADGKIRNIIVMVPDGTSVSHLTLARWMSDKGALALDPYARGLVRTFSSAGPINDSASTATAMATGVKTNAGYLSVRPEKVLLPSPREADAPLEKVPTVLELAKQRGKSVGLVVKSQLQHATPAAFSAHTKSRSDYDGIALQQVELGVDVALGGGLQYLSPEVRADKLDLVGRLQRSGATIVRDRAGMMQNRSASKLWGLFAQVSLPFALERDPARDPSLSEMTEVALDILSKNPKGFFLLVEGSMVDYAAHANCPVGVVSELLEFDSAAATVVEFARKRADTLVFVAPDHGNGGLSIGDDSLNVGFEKASLEEITGPLKRASVTNLGALEAVKADLSDLASVLASKYGLAGLTAAEEARLRKTIAETGERSGIEARMLIGRLLSARAHLGWTTGTHTGEDVPFFCLHPASRCPSGVIDNTAIGKFLMGEL